MTVRPSAVLLTVLLALAIWFPFEDFILKWVPVSDYYYSWLRFVSEATIYGLLVLVVISKAVRRQTFRRTPLDVPLLLFLVSATISIVASPSPLLGDLIGLRTLIRYVPVFYILAWLAPAEQQCRRLVAVIIPIAVVECLLGAAQFVLPAGVMEWFYPRATDLAIGGYQRNFTVLSERGLEIGAVIGTFGHSVSMALYLLIAVCILAATAVQVLRIDKRVPRRFWVTLALLAGGIALTYSRAATVVALGILPLAILLARSKRATRRLAWPVLAGGVGLTAVVLLSKPVDRTGSAKDVFFGPVENVLVIGSPDYISHGQATRLWTLREIGGVVASNPFGYGPHEESARQEIATSTNYRLARVLSYSAFEDVYWVALLAYFGVIGLVLYVWVLYRAGQLGLRVWRVGATPFARRVGLASAVSIMMAVPLTFVVRSFEFRTFGFYFWLLAGVAASLAPPTRR